MGPTSFGSSVGNFKRLDMSQRDKLRSETNWTKVSPKILLMKSSGNNFIFLSVFYLIIKRWSEAESFAIFENHDYIH